MFKKSVVLWCWCGLTPLTAQIYECLDEKGQRLWTNQTCQNAKVLHDGVSREEQLQAERSDKTQRAQRAKHNEAAAARFRENAYHGIGCTQSRRYSKVLLPHVKVDLSCT